ncbi:uncharacterized protein LOC135145667 [Zophobas morio]|uniref:uncharacterized protein LOC135145667 n=1 Tax=Zophobas morio TaxID=2755281 RepID=UPI00308361F4
MKLLCDRAIEILSRDEKIHNRFYVAHCTSLCSKLVDRNNKTTCTLYFGSHPFFLTSAVSENEKMTLFSVQKQLAGKTRWFFHACEVLEKRLNAAEQNDKILFLKLICLLRDYRRRTAVWANFDDFELEILALQALIESPPHSTLHTALCTSFSFLARGLLLHGGPRFYYDTSLWETYDSHEFDFARRIRAEPALAETAEDFIAELLSTNRFEDRNLKERQLEAVFHVNSEIGGIFSGTGVLGQHFQDSERESVTAAAQNCLRFLLIGQCEAFTEDNFFKEMSIKQ